MEGWQFSFYFFQNILLIISLIITINLLQLWNFIFTIFHIQQIRGCLSLPLPHHCSIPNCPLLDDNHYTTSETYERCGAMASWWRAKTKPTNYWPPFMTQLNKRPWNSISLFKNGKAWKVYSVKANRSRRRTRTDRRRVGRENIRPKALHRVNLHKFH